MKHTKEEIINALNVIKEECVGMDCEDCPFYKEPLARDTHRCAIMQSNPSQWSIDKPEPEPWRAFK